MSSRPKRVYQQHETAHNELSHKVGVIKDISLAIGEEIKSQNEQLKEMDERFSSTSGLMGQAMRNLRKLTINQGGCGWLFYFMAFACIVILFVWITRK